MSEEEARSALQSIYAKLQAAGIKTAENQVEAWFQQIRMLGKGYFMQPEAAEFINQLKMKYGL